MNDYNLNFISNEHLFIHTKETVLKYRFSMNLKEFNKNIVDPIKLTFDSKVYKKEIEQLINDEVMRQVDKSNTNHIGYFHQNIFNYIGDNWSVPKDGFDIINEAENIFVEMKNKHNTMNSKSTTETYSVMQNKIIKSPNSTCFLVEVIAKNSQNIPWLVSLRKEQISDERIRRVSIDKFYEIVTGEKEAFKKLCEILPKVIDDVVASIGEEIMQNSVLGELQELSSDVLKSLYMSSFYKYEGFDTFEFRL